MSAESRGVWWDWKLAGDRARLRFPEKAPQSQGSPSPQREHPSGSVGWKMGREVQRETSGQAWRQSTQERCGSTGSVPGKTRGVALGLAGPWGAAHRAPAFLGGSSPRRTAISVWMIALLWWHHFLLEMGCLSRRAPAGLPGDDLTLVSQGRRHRKPDNGPEQPLVGGGGRRQLWSEGSAAPPLPACPRPSRSEVVAQGPPALLRPPP